MPPALLADLVRHLPQNALSRLWGRLAQQTRPRPAIRLLKRGYARMVGMNMAEAAQAIDAYPSLEALFVRLLRPGLRPLATDPQLVISPVDGAMGQCGVVQAGELLQIKGQPYRLEELLGSEAAAARFEGGAYFTLYLAPHDYHRVHAPVAGAVRRSLIIPGGLQPVFPAALQRRPRLLCRNERLITYLHHATGPVALVMVGATLVGRMQVAYDPAVSTNAADRTPRQRDYQPPIPLDRGAELGTFALGSTVVLVFEKDRVEPLPRPFGAPIRLGEPLARLRRGAG